MNRSDRPFADVLTENNNRLWARCSALIEKHAKEIDEVAKDLRAKLGGADIMVFDKTEIESFPSVAKFELGSET
jgi:hypothetical protein